MVAELYMGSEGWFVWLDLRFGFASLIVEIDSHFVSNAFCREEASPSGTSASLYCTAFLV